MSTIEQAIKSQFAKVFEASDWPLFKTVAESNLKEAAKLLKGDMQIENSLKLLARNSRKRLLIGVGAELLLKAAYLKHGFAINRPPKNSQVRFPFLAKDAAGLQLDAGHTFMLHDLIESLPEVLDLKNRDVTLRGLKIAKVFRNKEGHVVTSAHTFDASNYTDIALSLRELYGDAFDETLSVRFSIAPDKVAVWRVVPNN